MTIGWDPDSYLALMAAEIADYEGLQAHLIEAARPVRAGMILDLGIGTGETARRVLAAHPGARLVGIDGNPDMLAAAGRTLAPDRVRLELRQLEEPLPAGPFDLVVSALAVHHLDGPAKADLFGRVRPVIAPGGRFVLADLVVPDDPDDVFTAIDGVVDRPSSVAEQLDWLAAAGFDAGVHWRYRDLAVLVGSVLPAE